MTTNKGIVDINDIRSMLPIRSQTYVMYISMEFTVLLCFKVCRQCQSNTKRNRTTIKMKVKTILDVYMPT